MTNPFPKTHKEFILWAKNISEEINKNHQGKGSVRVGKNKLAAIMANNLPNTSSDFNINTLKKLLDSKENQPIESEPSIRSYQVVVRADIHANDDLFDDWSLPIEWSCEDTTKYSDECEITAHCTTVVNVMASSKEEAMINAKEDAEEIGLSGPNIQIKIWIDESIDVEIIEESK